MGLGTFQIQCERRIDVFIVHCLQNSRIPIEHRPPIEARLVRGALYPPTPGVNGKYPQATVMVTPLEMEPEGVYNPSFDVTPAELITAIVTEKGVAVKQNMGFDLSTVL
jgi:methylthioribose-1-phosphate isomerase